MSTTHRRYIESELAISPQSFYFLISFFFFFKGYDLMGFELSKPRLRAELEADLKRQG